MSCEINFDGVDFEALSLYSQEPLSPKAVVSDDRLHAAIDSDLICSRPLTRAVCLQGPGEIDQRIQGIARKSGLPIGPMGNVSGEIGGEAKWGGDQGFTISGYLSGKVSDDYGNTASTDVTVRSDGSGSVSASVSHEEKTDS